MFVTSTQIADDKFGRFGNQLFRISAVIGTSVNLKCDYLFPNWKYSNFFVSEDLFNSNIEHYLDVSESAFHYTEIPKFEKSINLCGYFQSERYFENSKNEVKNILKFKDEYVQQFSFLHQKQCCSIHFRHGDIFDRQTGGGHVGVEEYHPVMTPEYYHSAMQHMINNKVNHFYIFYDHVETKEWIDKNINLKNINFTFVSNLDNNMQDFINMSLCEHNIIANSTFSWWAAWLNCNEEKIVIAPKNWFGPKYSHFDTKDLLPQKWLRI